jgi:hypothetical protein
MHNFRVLLIRFWQPFKRLLPPRFLNAVRWVYSPSFRLGQQSEKAAQQINHCWSQIERQCKGQIMSGPFSGMRYISSAVGSALAPKIVGTYEQELHPIIENIVRQQPDCIVDVGAAEGYYAVGLAMRIPKSRVVAFETNPDGREMLRQIASLNEISDRIDLQGYCTHDALVACLATAPPNSMIVCDIEGGELELLDPELLPRLKNIPILVELHRNAHPSIKEIFLSRFGSTSTITVLTSQSRRLEDFPTAMDQAGLSAKEKLACMFEFRPEGMEWLWITPKDNN